jgi:hypothetical protein
LVADPDEHNQGGQERENQGDPQGFHESVRHWMNDPPRGRAMSMTATLRL